VSADSILLTHAEVAVALAGFASVVAVLRYPLSSLQRQRFVMILFTALAGVLGALLPVWLSESGLTGPPLWRFSSAVGLVIILVVFVTSMVPMKALGRSARIIINQPVTYLVNVNFAAVIGTHMVNAFALFEPSFSFYYAALLGGLISTFVIFADVVLGQQAQI
jgi:hypothetical protein